MTVPSPRSPVNPAYTGPLFGLAYSPIQASAFGSLTIPSLDFEGSEQFTSFM
jgi:hypothetical protein